MFKQFSNGVQEIASPRGIGNAVGIFIVFAILATAFALTPNNALAEAKRRLRIGA